MAKLLRTYENAVEATILCGFAGPGGLTTKQAIACLELAHECDSLTRRLVEDAQEMAVRCEKFATDLAGGYFHATLPTSYSSIHDMPTNGAQLKAKREALVAMLRVCFGQEAVKAVFDHMAKALDVPRPAVAS